MSKQFYYKQFSLALVRSLKVKKKFSLVLFDPKIGPYQLLPLRPTVDVGAMAMKGYSVFLKAPALLEPHHQIA